MRSFTTWHAAAPLFHEAEGLFAAQADQRNVLYAHIGQLRGEIESQSLPEASEYLADILGSPVAQSDLPLRLFCLVAKGDIDFQIDPKSSEAVWTEVSKVATRLRDGVWENRAQAELGTIAFYKGEIYRGDRMVQLFLHVVLRRARTRMVGAVSRFRSEAERQLLVIVRSPPTGPARRGSYHRKFDHI